MNPFNKPTSRFVVIDWLIASISSTLSRRPLSWSLVCLLSLSGLIETKSQFGFEHFIVATKIAGCFDIMWFLKPVVWIAKYSHAGHLYLPSFVFWCNFRCFEITLGSAASKEHPSFGHTKVCVELCIRKWI